MRTNYFIIFGLVILHTCSIRINHLNSDHHNEETWTQIDINNLSDKQKSAESFAKSSVSAIKDLSLEKGFESNGKTNFQYSVDNVVWNILVSGQNDSKVIQSVSKLTSQDKDGKKLITRKSILKKKKSEILNDLF